MTAHSAPDGAGYDVNAGFTEQEVSHILSTGSLPDQTAPDALVEVLAGALCPSHHREGLAWSFTRTDGSASSGRSEMRPCTLHRAEAEALAPTVAQLVREAEERAVAEALTELAGTWQMGAWADAPRRADRVQERLANAQYVTDWLRNAAQTPRNGPQGAEHPSARVPGPDASREGL